MSDEDGTVEESEAPSVTAGGELNSGDESKEEDEDGSAILLKVGVFCLN